MDAETMKLTLVLTAGLIAAGLLSGCRRSPDPPPTAPPPMSSPTSATESLTSNPPVASDEAQELVRRGIEAGQRGDIDASVAAFQQAIRVRPELAEAHASLGVALGMRGNRTEAIAEFKEAVRLQPRYAPVYPNLAYALLEEGDFSAAGEAAEQGLQLTPNHPQLHVTLGVARSKTGDSEGALTAFHNALNAGAGPEARLQLGLTLRGRGDVAQAVRELERAAGEMPSNGYAQAVLAEALVEAGDAEAGVAAAHRAVAADRFSQDAFLALANALCAQQHGSAAREAALSAARLNNDDPRSHYLLGRAYLLLDRPNDAREEYDVLHRTDKILAGKLLKEIKDHRTRSSPGD